MDATTKSLYQRLTEAGIETSNWQSDLYFPVTERSTEIVKAVMADGLLSSRPTAFLSRATGVRTYEAPFMFDPYWGSERLRK